MAVTSGRNLLAHWLHERVVITVPGEIDVTNSSQLKETLLEAIGRRPAVVVVDMTATTFCDSSGMRAIVSAYRQAAAAGAELRVATGQAGPRRVFELSGVDTVISVYPDVPAALSSVMRLIRAEVAGAAEQAREGSSENVLMGDETNRPPAVGGTLALFRHAAAAVAAGRVVLGLVALTRPSAVARPWVGASADELGAQVFGRALGARDLALGLGALAATYQAPDSPRSAGAWYAAGALSDALDFAITAAAWPRLPRATRWLIAASAGGAAITGAAGTVALLLQ